MEKNLVLRLVIMKLAIINTTRQNYGGNAYEKMTAEVLSKEFDIKFISTGVKIKNNFKYLGAPFVLWRIFKTSRKKEFDVVIRTFLSSLFLNKKPVKNIAIIHHIDNSATFVIKRIIYFFLEKLIFWNIKKCDAVVTVAKYWENYFKQKGYKNIYRIYNAFNLADFNFSKEEIELFKEKYNLTEKPIIYIGNCQKAKGVLESYNILKDLNVYLVTSGRARVKVPARNLELNYRDYLLLLKSSSVVVTMSKFKEGWNRTAHEAMLCKTPVIGSGEGGMKELLEGGKQIICKDFFQLKEKVEFCLECPEIGKRGYDYAKHFTKENFEKEWINLVKNL